MDPKELINKIQIATQLGFTQSLNNLGYSD